MPPSNHRLGKHKPQAYLEQLSSSSSRLAACLASIPSSSSQQEVCLDKLANSNKVVARVCSANRRDSSSNRVGVYLVRLQDNSNNRQVVFSANQLSNNNQQAVYSVSLLNSPTSKQEAFLGNQPNSNLNNSKVHLEVGRFLAALLDLARNPSNNRHCLATL